MSNERILPLGYKFGPAFFQGPFYPEVLENIQRRYAVSPERINPSFFKYMEREAKLMLLDKPSTKVIPVTTDGYMWLAAFVLVHDEVSYQFLFPFGFDTHWKDGTVADRSIVAFARDMHMQERPIDPIMVDEMAKACVTVFEHTYNSLYAT